MECDGSTSCEIKPVKKGSYPSRQKRQGPAPLASFEDLPSDDQESPEDGRQKGFGHGSPDIGTIEKALEGDCRELLNSSPTRTLTPIGFQSPEVCTSRNEHDGLSQHTVTPAGQDLSPSSGKNSLNEFILQETPQGDKKTEKRLSNSHSFKGSQSSLLIPGAPDDESKSPSPESKRKGSWTDVFFKGKNRSRSKSPNENEQKSPVNEDSKKKKGFFSFLKIGGRKSPNKEVDANSQQNNVVSKNTQASKADISTPRVSVTDTSEIEAREELLIPGGSDDLDPVESQQDIIGIIEAEQHAMQEQMQVKSAINKSDLPNEIAEPLPPPNLSRRKLKKRADTTDDEIKSLPEILPSSRSKENDLYKLACNVETVIATIEHRPDDKEYSSESEMGFDESTLTAKKQLNMKKQSSNASEDDYEAATLLAQDSVDFEDSYPSENHNTNETNLFKQPKTPTRRERLEVTTIPIDRPRSTTPINIAPLEAFIKSATTSPDPNVEKIKLSLPGEFTASTRAKSPRKSNPQIWLDFCEKGLQSPKTTRRQRDQKEQSTISVPLTADAFTPVTETPSQAVTPLTPVTPLEDDSRWDMFQDNFDPFTIIKSNGANLSRDCNKCDCRLGKPIISREHTADTTPVDDKPLVSDSGVLYVEEHLCVEEQQPLVSPNACCCECHVAYADFAIWKNVALEKRDSILSDSSDISSASSRLIGSSSSSKSLAEEPIS